MFRELGMSALLETERLGPGKTAEEIIECFLQNPARYYASKLSDPSI